MNQPAPGPIIGHFKPLLAALSAILLLYPYVPMGRQGAFLGGLLSMVVVVAGVVALKGRGWVCNSGRALAALAISCHAVDLIWPGMMPGWCVEAGYSLVYAFFTASVLLVVLWVDEVTPDTVIGGICVYLLMGLAFGQIYDLTEALAPGSFTVAGLPEGGHVGWRTLVFYSFMTLTTVGYGDITPATPQMQSLAIIESAMGTLFLAVFIAQLVGHSARPRISRSGRRRSSSPPSE